MKIRNQFMMLFEFHSYFCERKGIKFNTIDYQRIKAMT